MTTDYENVIAAWQRQQKIKASGKGVRVILADGSVFWSTGSMACPFGCYKGIDKPIQMIAMRETIDGVIRVGFYCSMDAFRAGANYPLTTTYYPQLAQEQFPR